MNESQFLDIKQKLREVKKDSFLYKEKLKNLDIEKIVSKEDFEKLPFTEKKELRNGNPLGLLSVAEEKVVRIHSTSGTTGKPVIVPYTQKDIDDWIEMFCRCYSVAGLTKMDRVQITPGYGLWTAGIGFQLGAENFGSMVIPMGPGNTDKQLDMLKSMQTTVLCSTSSYANLLSEEVKKRGLLEEINLKKGIIGSEFWGEKTRKKIADNLKIELYDIYGLTEVYGPGIGISCDMHQGIHFWDDFVYFEIIDPKTGRVLPKGEIGELVITTFKKEGAPLIRYRTHDLTSIIDEPCSCGLKFPRISKILGRTDDMVKIKGVNIFPNQIESVLNDFENISPEYRMIIEKFEGKDKVLLLLEKECNYLDTVDSRVIIKKFREKIGITINVELLASNILKREEKKTKRIIDRRFA